MMRLRLLLVLLAATLSTHILQSRPYEQALSTGWEFRKTGDPGWMPAKVPGNCFTDLFENGIIPDPFSGANEAGLRWVDTCDWEYRLFFNADSILLRCENIRLRFDGLDTYAEVLLNGKRILLADNMYRTWETDVRSILRFGRNELTVRFSAALRKAATLAAAYPQRLPGGDRVFVRKAAFHWGWDFGPRFLGCGIWKPVVITGWNHLRITDAYVRSQHSGKNDAKLKLRVQLESTVDRKVLLRTSVENAAQEEVDREVKLRHGIQTVEFDFNLRDVKRWWTHQLGDPFSYEFLVSVAAPGMDTAVRRFSFGVRDLKLVQRRDSIGESFYFTLNGIPVFMKGANMVPPDHFVARIDSSMQAALIADARRSNFNMLRVWGGGIYPDDDFFGLCDRNGILVWQDFMAACSMIPADTSFLSNMREEVRQQVVRLRNHPSLAIWCGNNECDEGWHNWGWQKEFGYSAADSAAVWHDYLSVFHRMIPEVLKSEDPGRSYRPSSPSIGWGRPESLRSGDAHYWGVWWGHQPFSVYEQKTGRFMTEYGFQGIPCLKTIRTFAGDKGFDLRDAGLQSHQKHPTGFETIREYMERSYDVPEDFSNHVYLSQIVQAEGIIGAIESHRRQRHRCMGTLYWQFNDSWPGISWSSRDYYGRWKMLQYAVREAYATLMITTKEKDRKVDVYVVSDSVADYLARMELRLIDVYGNIRWSEIVPADIKANASTLVCSRDFRRLVSTTDTANVILNVRILKGDGIAAERNGLFCLPRNLHLMKPAMTVRALTTADGKQKIELKSSSFVRCMEVSWKDDPSVFDRNYIDMFPGERYEFTITSPDYSPSAIQEIRYRSLIDTF
jgi:beta-mannosidase